MEETLVQIGTAVGAAIVVAGQAVSYVLGRRDTRALREHVAERSLDPSEVKVLREWSGRLHEIGELRESIERLSRVLHDEALDRGELRRVRSFFFGSEHRPAELHLLKSDMAAAKLHREQHEMRLAAVEKERRESNQRLDERLRGLEQQLSDYAQTMTEILKRLPTPPGMRGTPPDGSPLPETGE